MATRRTTATKRPRRTATKSYAESKKLQTDKKYYDAAEERIKAIDKKLDLLYEDYEETAEEIDDYRHEGYPDSSPEVKKLFTYIYRLEAKIEPLETQKKYYENIQKRHNFNYLDYAVSQIMGKDYLKKQNRRRATEKRVERVSNRKSCRR